jgi:plastocyanin
MTGSDSGGKEGGVTTLNGCSQADFDANDKTAVAGAAERAIHFTTAVVNQYSPPCMKIKAGQSVTWSSADGRGQAFASHPLEPAGGSANSPITLLDQGDAGTFTFPAAGIFGFECAMHSRSMFGAILVVP